jgi:hypothetical protein
MSNNSKASAKRKQVIYSEPRRTFVKSEKRVSKKGVEYTVNIYRKNINAKPIKEIVHNIIPGDEQTAAWNGFKSKIKQSR